MMRSVDEVVAAAIDRLERRRAVRTAIHATRGTDARVHATVEARSPVGSAALRMPLGDERLRSAVAPLLAQKRSRRRPASVPHERAGMEADLVAGVEDAETQVDVVAGGLVTHIEPADRVEHLATDSEIASG